jgi:hypothetical protein
MSTRLPTTSPRTITIQAVRTGWIIYDYTERDDTEIFTKWEDLMWAVENKLSLPGPNTP